MSQILILLLVLSTGSLLGSIPIKGFYLESLGILIVGMIFGHYGHVINPIIMEFGLALFIYGIALQIGPGFIENFKKDGIKLSFIALIMTFFVGIVTFIIGHFSGFSPRESGGLFSGIYNNALSLAPLLNHFGSSGSSEISRNFGAVYPFAFAGAMIFIAFLPKIMRINIDKEVKDYEDYQHSQNPAPETRCFKAVNPGVAGKELSELNLPGLVGVTIARIFRNGKTVVPEHNTVLLQNDILEAIGQPAALAHLETVLGEQWSKKIPWKERTSILVDRRYLVTNKSIVGKRLSELHLQERYGATVTRIRRGEVDIPVTKNTKLVYGDRITAVVKKQMISELEKILGNNLQTFTKQELYPVALGLAIGALIGLIKIGPMKVGFSAGVLLTGMVAGRIGNLGPIVFTVSAQANHVLKRLGLMLFMAALGTMSGVGLIDGLASIKGLVLIVTGILMITTALSLAAFIARKIMKRNIVETMAIVAGSIACTPALELSNAQMKNDDSTVTYASIYPMGIMAPVFFAQIIIMVFG
ncbi:hypothetical protein KKF34_04955 [Myxococcota bacterium]|nr:hypothetical protein [Myxococcota bacterium]MBU1381192.1 hypothetical protein [Myxococcota bacterium]MBU1496209.1 hypothetical protein [Myxococcota bacterium]